MHQEKELRRITHLIAGGVPAGIKIPTPAFECRITRTKINITTMHGKRRTTPSGIENLELPLKRSGRRKKANLDESRGFFDLSFSNEEGRLIFPADGRRFHTLCTKLILIVVVGLLWQASYLARRRTISGANQSWKRSGWRS